METLADGVPDVALDTPATMSMSDESSISDETIRCAARGERSAQQRLYEALAGRIQRIVQRIVGANDVEDVSQEVFVNLFQKMHSFRFDSSFTTWAHRLAVNDALQHLRRARRRATVPLEAAHGSGEPVDGIDAAERRLDMVDLFESAYARLEDDLRIILELKEVHDFSYAQIAMVMGVPEGTVGSRLNRARRQLRTILIDLGWEAG
jgi:RNA polymerase sigma-70 factor (ECF subfamily)